MASGVARPFRNLRREGGDGGGSWAAGPRGVGVCPVGVGSLETVQRSSHGTPRSRVRGRRFGGARDPGWPCEWAKSAGDLDVQTGSFGRDPGKVRVDPEGIDVGVGLLKEGEARTAPVYLSPPRCRGEWERPARRSGRRGDATAS